MTLIRCAQLAPRVGDLAENRERVLATVGAAVARGVELLVLPELASSGYVFTDAAEARSVAVRADGALLADWAVAAGAMTVVVGFCELGDDGALYNSAAVCDRGAVVEVYRKTHLWDAEKLVFTPGDRPPPVVATGAGRIGVAICYDLEFPELTRSLAVRGAEVIAAPVNWPLVPRPMGERPPEAVQAMAAARTNRVAVAICDRDGTERGQAWTEGSTIIGVDGWVAADGSTSDGTVEADVELSGAADKTISPRNDVLRDRRPDLYG